MLQLYLELLLLLRRELKLRQDDTLLLLMLKMLMMRRMRLIDSVFLALRRLLGTSRKHDSSLDSRIGDAGDAAGRSCRLLRRFGLDECEGIRRRRRMRRGRRELVLPKFAARLLNEATFIRNDLVCVCVCACE